MHPLFASLADRLALCCSQGLIDGFELRQDETTVVVGSERITLTLPEGACFADALLAQRDLLSQLYRNVQAAAVPESPTGWVDLLPVRRPALQ